MNDFAVIVDSPLGGLGIRTDGESVSGIEFLGEAATLIEPVNSTARRTAEQLQQYFHDPAFEFDLEVSMSGTKYQKRVWAALTGIRSGETQTYGALAQQLGSSARAVGGACRANPVPLIIPCHRVTAAHSRGGYMGSSRQGQSIKSWLLAHESGRR